MPRKTSALTVKEIDALRWDGSDRKLTDGRTPGLQLFLKSTGKTWRLKHRFAGREKLVTLGHYPAMGLADARQAAGEKRALLARGIDPVADRREKEAASRAAQETTEGSFEAVAREWVEQVHRHRVVPSHAERNLRRLERLNLSLNRIRDISSLAGLRSLEVLEFSDNFVEDIAALRNLRNLENLVFNKNAVSDLSPLASKSLLVSLFFENNRISDLSPLAGLPNLRRLRLRVNDVVDLSPLATLEKLLTADVRNNPLSAASTALIEEIEAGSNTRITF